MWSIKDTLQHTQSPSLDKRWCSMAEHTAKLTSPQFRLYLKSSVFLYHGSGILCVHVYGLKNPTNQTKKNKQKNSNTGPKGKLSQNWHLLGNARRLTYVCSFSKTAVNLFMSLCSSIFLALKAAVQREDSHSSSKLGIYELFFLKKVSNYLKKQVNEFWSR